MTETIDRDAVLALVRWQHTRRNYGNDAALLQTGFSLLRCTPPSALARAEAVLNLPRQRIVSEILHFAVFLMTKSKEKDTQVCEALHLVHMALHVFSSTENAQLATLPLNSCNLVLLALAEMLEKVKEDEKTLETLKDVKAVLAYLFGVPDTLTESMTADFHMYRPPPNVFADFLKRLLTAAFQQLLQRQESDEKTKMKQERLYVDLVHTSLFVFRDLQKTQTNKKKVFLAMAKTFLKDFIAFRLSLTTLWKRGVSGLEIATTLMDDIVIEALFDAENIRHFEGAMVHTCVWKSKKSKGAAQEESDDKLDKKRQKPGRSKAALELVSYQKTLFDELLNLLSDPEVAVELKASVGGFFEVLVRGFATRIRSAAATKIEDTKTDLKKSRKRAAIVIATTSTAYSPFKFWSELCAVAYSAYQQESNKSAFLPILVTLFHALFRALYECDVYRVTEDTEEREQFQTMEKVLASIIRVLNVDMGNATFFNAPRASEECEIVSNAVRCSPNLVQCCLVPIFELLGREAERGFSACKRNDGKSDVIVATSRAVIELLHAYESMRLLGVFLKATFAIDRAHEGLYHLFTIPSCESALRQSFLSLPSGQIDTLWKLMVEQIALFASREDKIPNVHGVAFARLVFQIFVQEIHVVRENSSKVLELAADTCERLVSSFENKLIQANYTFSYYEQEVFCIVGELLMFDSVLSVSTRERTFDPFFKKLEGNRFGAAMKQLFRTSTNKDKLVDNTMTSHDTRRGLGVAGVVKLCVYWLRQYSSGEDDNERKKVAPLVIKYVTKWKCWDAIAFSLPELMASASNDECYHFFCEILSAYISEAVTTESEGLAKRIVGDAAFYEILSLRKVASRSLTTVGKSYVDGVQRGSADSLALAYGFFCFLSEIPSAYLEPKECGDLLVTALNLYHVIDGIPNNAKHKKDVCHKLLAWIQLHFRVIGVEVHKSPQASSEFKNKLRSVSLHIVLQLHVDDAVSTTLISEILRTFLDLRATAFVGKLLNFVLDTDHTKEKITDKSTRKLRRAVVVVRALAACRNTLNSSKEENEFVENVVDLVTREKVCNKVQDPLCFEVMGALLQYQFVLHRLACHDKSQQTTMVEGPVLQVLVKHFGVALTASMKTIVATNNSMDDRKLYDTALSLFAIFCEAYASFRVLVTPLVTYGCLLAVSLALASRNARLSSSPDTTEITALQALMSNANRDEFRLLLSTLVQELVAREAQRKLGALRVLCLLLGGDRKIGSSRRILLHEHKESFVKGLLVNFTDQSHTEAVTSDDIDSAVALRLWNLKAFVLMFSKAELFTWKNHELQFVFMGFQPVMLTLSCWQAGDKPYEPQELHELWTNSYALLLRIVRNHFLSLVNGIPLLVQASNALLQLLVLASADARYSKICSEWSSNLARLYGYMKVHDVPLRKYVIYPLMAFFVAVTRDKLALHFQQKLRPGIFALLDVCSSYEKEQLFAALDSSGKSLLKSLDANYKLTHRYVGKI
ncbi:hypothetical protein PsorP6_003541 [Peronosclerospora sorghi]|uniref:Uncharacterized protein n=1 Tax=Peronosclerospora sorghi TaxID=230839 RepID=A0ACC0VNT1_9STRA|nr:hypothetical protein PsorP6_003541 [Peronosclerospora sorghi]